MASQSALQQSLESYKTTSSIQDFHSLHDKVVVITVKYNPLKPLKMKTHWLSGGGNGIGLALVKAVAEFGGHVAVIGQRERPDPQLLEIQDLHDKIQLKYFRCEILYKRKKFYC